MVLGTPAVDGGDTPRRAKSSSTLVRFAGMNVSLVM